MKNPKATSNRSWIDAIKRGKAGPPVLAEDEPEVDDGKTLLPESEPYWEAFRILNLQRGTGYQGPESLTISDIRAYGEIGGWDTTDVAFFLEMVVEMDQMYLTATYKKIQEERERKERQSNRGR